MKIRIICVGNRFVAADGAGPRVYDFLARGRIPAPIELVDGGLAGLDLLPLVEGCKRVVFVDAVTGFDSMESVQVLTREEAAAGTDPFYDHGAGLAFLLNVIPRVCAKPLPEIFLVGLEGAPDPGKVARAARLSLTLAAGEHQPEIPQQELTRIER